MQPTCIHFLTTQALEPLLTYLLSPIFKFYIPGMFYMGTPLLVPVRLNFVLNFVDVTESQYIISAYIQLVRQLFRLRLVLTEWIVSCCGIGRDLHQTIAHCLSQPHPLLNLSEDFALCKCFTSTHQHILHKSKD